MLTIAVSRYDVASHDSSRMPWRSPTIVGSAVATIVVSSDDSALPIISPANTIHTARGTAGDRPCSLAPPVVTAVAPLAESDSTGVG